MEALDGRRPVIRPIPHVAILRDEFTQLFNDDYEEEEEEMEARGEHTLSEKFGGHFAALVNGTLCLEVFKINHTCWVYSCSVRVPARLVERLSYAHRTRVRAQMHLALPQPARGVCGGVCALPKLSERPRQPRGRLLTRSASRCSLPGAHVRPRLQPDLRGLPKRSHVRCGGDGLRVSGGLDRHPL